MQGPYMILNSLMKMISFWPTFSTPEKGTDFNGNDVQKILIEGNRRYTDAKSIHPNQTSERRMELAKGQHPIAAILACADSRVPPEIIFDQGLGDLFVIRLAGNILNKAALGSLEYAVTHLGIKYIMVLGHTRCGAVEATLQGGEAPGHIGSIIKAIQPAVDKAKNMPGNVVDNAVRINVITVVKQLKSLSTILADNLKKGDLIIKGAYYNLDNGAVEILP